MGIDTKELRILSPTEMICPKCNGEGVMMPWEAPKDQAVCNQCKGTGEIEPIPYLQSELDALRARVQELERKHLILFNADTTIEMLEEGLEARGKVKELESQLKGKRASPEVTTICECPDCHAVTRWSRHLDMDCKTIQGLRQQLAEATTPDIFWTEDGEGIEDVESYIRDEWVCASEEPIERSYTFSIAKDLGTVTKTFLFDPEECEWNEKLAAIEAAKEEQRNG